MFSGETACPGGQKIHRAKDLPGKDGSNTVFIVKFASTLPGATIVLDLIGQWPFDFGAFCLGDDKSGWRMQ